MIKNEGLYITGISIRGKSHLKNSTPCQDAYAYGIYKEKNGIIVVSDGAGSARKSEISSHLIVNYVQKLTKEYFDNIFTEKVIKEIFQNSFNLLANEANRQKIDLQEFAATLILVVFTPQKIIVGHIGDGGVVVKSNEKLILISEPENGEYINETSFITDKNWQDSLRITLYNMDINGVIVFTDGCQRGIIYMNSEGKFVPFNKFFFPIFEYISNEKDKKKIRINLMKLLYKKFSRVSDDDKTMVIGVYE